MPPWTLTRSSWRTYHSVSTSQDSSWGWGSYIVQCALLHNTSILRSPAKSNELLLKDSDVAKQLVKCMVCLTSNDNGRVFRRHVLDEQLERHDRHVSLARSWGTLDQGNTSLEDVTKRFYLRAIERGLPRSRRFGASRRKYSLSSDRLEL